MIRIISVVLAGIIFGGFTIMIVGYFSAPFYSNSILFEMDSPPNVIWNDLVNMKDSTIKKADVSSVDVFDKYGSLIAWQENLKDGGFRRYRMTHRVEERNLVVELMESSYGLTGMWYFVLEKKDSKTLVTITEESTLDNTILRGTRFFFGRDRDLLVWVKYIRVGLLEHLLTTP